MAAVSLVAVLSLAMAGQAENADGDDANKPAVKDVKADQPSFTAEQTAEGMELFQKHVRLVLAHKCVTCHGGDSTEGEFNITTHEGLLRGSDSGAAVKLGSGKESHLYKLAARLEEPYMPDEGENLTAEELAHLARWIDLGAPYDKPLVESDADDTPWTERKVAKGAHKFWSFQPLKSVEPSAVKNEAWPRTPVDRFVLAKLEEMNLAPNGPAERRTLIRRAYYDLIGLPPTLEEIEAFVNDESPEAYGKVIDRLLESPHYGERWGRHWLDVARFAESHGFEQDYDRPFAFHFRDFVIEALNRDMPFDQFVRWQLAGDELAPDDPLALKATGFLGGGVFPTQITANEVERTRYDALDDMAGTTGVAFLGLTIGCARCHDHKFDPIPQADYYRFISIFTTTVRSNLDVNLDPQGYRAAKEAFDREHAPLVAARTKYENEELPARLAAWEKDLPGQTAIGWVVLDPVESKSQGGATLTRQAGGALLATGTNPAHDTYTIVAAAGRGPITGVRIEALADDSLVKKGPGRASNGNFALTDVKVLLAPKNDPPAAKQLVLSNARATFEQKGLPVAATIDGDAKSAWAIDPQFGKDHAAIYDVAEPLQTTSVDAANGEDGKAGEAGGERLVTFVLKFENNAGHNIGRLRLSVTSAPQPLSFDGGTSHEIAALLDTPAEKRAAEQQAKLLAWFGPRDEDWRALDAVVQSHLAKAPQPKIEKMMVCSEGVTPIRHHTQGADFFNESYFLRRGNCDQKEGVASPGFLQILMKSPDGTEHWRKSPPEGAHTSFRRTALANWITDTEQGAGQLLARVIVNRLWQHHFGRGIVATASDFGKQGTAPTHPELLDYLAGELIRGGWRLKPIHRLMMTSSTYMQSGDYDDARAKIDPENNWLWRRAPQRLEAEIIRDAMLAVSGSLDNTQFGPGTLDEGHRRRSIYFMIKRSRLISMMQLFDQPEPLVSVGGRPTTTVAPQALAIMNNPHIREYAKAFAHKLRAGADESTAAAIRRGYEVAVGRAPTSEEIADAATFIDAQRGSYAKENKADGEELALADFCQVLFGLNEFVYVE
ncbi:MAG: PSD1 and planctomycete cytochrome C domain-containing protein [Pirellulales bacterium]